MKTSALRVACLVVRAWTYVYTSGLPAHARDSRRAEIASDLWECQHDASRRGDTVSALQVLGRLLLGIPDDLTWRVTQFSNGWAFAAGLATLALAAVTWFYLQILGPQTLPPPRPLPMVFVGSPPPPPPPPPPRPLP